MTGLEDLLDTARQAATAGAKAALRYFGTQPRVRLKPDRSPVTDADQAAEAAILAVIRARHPDHDILAEESGAQGRGARRRWIVDPLDGTRGFARGSSFWGPLVALEEDGSIIAGALVLPVLGQSYYAARGLGCWRDGVRLRVSEVASWPDATLSLGELGRLLRPPWGAGVTRLATTAASVRGYGDLAGATLLLDGRAEAWIEAGVQIWDLAPMVVLVEEAGGRFTDCAGGQDLATGTAIASNGRLHGHIIATLG